MRTPRRERRLLIGLSADVHGHWDVLAADVGEAHVRAGRPLDLLVCAGDSEPLRSLDDLALVHGPAKYRRLGEFHHVGTGTIDLGVPVVFIGGNHDPWRAFDEAERSAHLWPIPWVPGVAYLGRAGARVLDVGGEPVSLAWLGGIYSPKVSPGAVRDRCAEGPARDAKVRSYYAYEELAAVRRAVRRLGGIDLFISHDWPAGIGNDRTGTPTGDPRIAELVADVAPTLAVCGHHHHRHSAVLGTSACEALARPGGAGGLLVAQLDVGRAGSTEVRLLDDAEVAS